MRKNIWLYVFAVVLAATLAMPGIGLAQGRGNSDHARGPKPDRAAVAEQDHGGGKPETAGNRGGRGNAGVQGQPDGRGDGHGPPPHAQARGRGQDVHPTSTPGVSGLVGPQSQHGKVGICHVTGSATNRYVFLIIPDHAAAHHVAHYNKDGFGDVPASSPAECEALEEIQARAALAARATATARTTTLLGSVATATRTPTATATATSTPTATATATGTSASGSVTGQGRGRGRGLALGQGNDAVETQVLGSTETQGPDVAGMAVAGLLILGGTLVVRRLLAARR